MKRAWLAFFAFAPALAWADPLSQRGLDEANPTSRMTNEMIDERRKVLDKVLAKRNDEASKEAAEAIALETKLKQERAEFEKKQIADRKTFLEALKMESDDRKRVGMYARFNNDQKSARRKFFNDQQNRRDELSYRNRKVRMLPHDDVEITATPAPTAKPSTKSPKK